MKPRYLVALALIALVVAACGSAPAYVTPTPLGYAAPTALDTAPVATTAPDAAQAAESPAPGITNTVGITTSVPGGVEVALAKVKPVEGVLATVNGEEITWKQFEPALTYLIHVFTLQYGIDW